MKTTEDKNSPVIDEQGRGYKIETFNLETLKLGESWSPPKQMMITQNHNNYNDLIEHYEALEREQKRIKLLRNISLLIGILALCASFIIFAVAWSSNIFETIFVGGIVASAALLAFNIGQASGREKQRRLSAAIHLDEFHNMPPIPETEQEDKKANGFYLGKSGKGMMFSAKTKLSSDFSQENARPHSEQKEG